MILVDTSIWIEFFRGIDPYFTRLRKLIENSDIVAHEVIFGELFQGCKSKEELLFISEYLLCINRLNSEGSFIEGGKLSFQNKYISKGIGLIDSVLISEARKQKIQIWTLDKKLLKALSKEEIYI
ncbi:MAG: PIN domain-containing protein [Leptospira sp.]|jgi:predicted nucleic acid-binding protein|nr:PIN domain-containing protein [Leptospira sp.]